MNKLFIGLLIVAAGAGAFFLLRKKKSQVSVEKINHEWIIGTWKTEAMLPGDSLKTGISYDFRKDGKLYRSLNDAAGADTSSYAWKGERELVLPPLFQISGADPADSSGMLFTVVMLTRDSLQLLSADSTATLFTRPK